MTAAAASIAGFESRAVDIDGVAIHCWTGGDSAGPPVLLWHGFLGTSYAWRHVMTALADAGAAVLVPDMRGYGDSDKPVGEKGYDGRALAEKMRALVRSTGFGGGRPLTLVAHDMGAPPALLWAADHPDEIAALFYVEEPVMLGNLLAARIGYASRESAARSMWWWLLSLAPRAPETLIVGNERAFLSWFYDRDPATSAAIDPITREEYLRTISGREGVLGALGVYRAAFTTIAQTEPLTANKVTVPVVAIGGAKAQGASVGEMLAHVAHDVETVVVADCGHFVAEEAPDAITGRILAALGIERARIPADDVTRDLTLARPDDPELEHLAVAGDTYTILVRGDDTDGRYAVIDMLVPPGGGPPPHRHDFEEMFHVLEGSIEVTLRDRTATAEAGETVNVPANVPHSFHNASDVPARLQCLVSPAGLEAFFAEFADPVASRTALPPQLTKDEREQRMRKAADAAPGYGIELL